MVILLLEKCSRLHQRVERVNKLINQGIQDVKKCGAYLIQKNLSRNQICIEEINRKIVLFTFLYLSKIEKKSCIYVIEHSALN